MNKEIISVEGLSKAFDGQNVLHNISANVKSGEIIALLGLNGSGKTTLLETILGFCLPEQGLIKIFGSETTVMTDENIKRRIGFVPQQEELLLSMKVEHYLYMIGTFYPNWDNALVNRLCEEWAVPSNKIIRKLSVGQRQKVAIISALAFSPELIILDEPVASLDPKARRQFLTELINIADTSQCSIVFSTHIVSDVERIADRLWLLKEGQLVLDVEIDEIKESTVRIHLNTEIDYEFLLEDMKLINRRTSSGHKVLTLSGWNDVVENKWKTEFGNELTIERLSLEDIFLEMNS